MFTVAGWGRCRCELRSKCGIFGSSGRDLSAFWGGVTSQTREFYVPSKHGQLSNTTLSAALGDQSGPISGQSGRILLIQSSLGAGNTCSGRRWRRVSSPETKSAIPGTFHIRHGELLGGCPCSGGDEKTEFGWGMRASPSSPTLNVGISIPGKREKSLPGSPLRRIARAKLENEKSVQRKKQRVERISAGWRGHPNALWVPNQQPCGAEIMRRRSGPIPARGVSGLMGGRLQP